MLWVNHPSVAAAKRFTRSSCAKHLRNMHLKLARVRRARCASYPQNMHSQKPGANNLCAVHVNNMQAAACRKPATRQARACQAPHLALVLPRSPATTRTPARFSTTWQPSAGWTLACHAWQVGHTQTPMCGCVQLACLHPAGRRPGLHVPTRACRNWAATSVAPRTPCAAAVLSADCRRCALCVVAVCVSWACRL